MQSVNCKSRIKVLKSKYFYSMKESQICGTRDTKYLTHFCLETLKEITQFEDILGGKF